MSSPGRPLRVRGRVHWAQWIVIAVPVVIALGPNASPGEPTGAVDSVSPVPRVAALLNAVPDGARFEPLARADGFEVPPLPLPSGSLAEPFTLRTSVTDTEPLDLRTLARGERWHLARFDAVALSPGLDTQLSAYGRVAYVPGNAGPVEPSTDDPVSIGLRGKLGDFELCAEYRSVGKRLERVLGDGGRDQETAQVWLARRFGPMRLKLSQAELSDNVDKNPALPRTTRVQTALTAELLPADWAVVGVTFASGDLERARLGPAARERAPERYGFNSMTASVYHDAGWWGAGVSATYTRTRDLAASNRDSEGLYQDASVWMRFVETLTVTSSAGAGQEQYLWSGATSDSASGWLSVTYTPPRSRWHAWTVAGGTLYTSSDRSADGRTVNVGAGIGWDLSRWLGARSTVSVEAGYDRYMDGISPGGSSRSLFGLVLLTVKAP